MVTNPMLTESTCNDVSNLLVNGGLGSFAAVRSFRVGET